MKKNNKITIIIAALLVVIAGVLIWNNRYLSTIQGESSDFQVWDTASVTKIYLADRRENESLELYLVQVQGSFRVAENHGGLSGQSAHDFAL